MSNAEEMRKILNILTESATKPVDIEGAKELLMKISPTVRDSDELVEDGGMSAATGAFIAFISVFVGGTEVANIGPLDFNGATQMQQEIVDDIERSYEKYHPQGFTDGSGTIFRLSDWDVNIETCHSSECNDIVKPRVDAIRARNANK